MNYFKSIMLTAFALFALAACDTDVHKGYFGRSVLDFIFPWFCPVFVPR